MTKATYKQINEAIKCGDIDFIKKVAKEEPCELLFPTDCLKGRYYTGLPYHYQFAIEEGNLDALSEMILAFKNPTTIEGYVSSNQDFGAYNIAISTIWDTVFDLVYDGCENGKISSQSIVDNLLFVFIKEKIPFIDIEKNPLFIHRQVKLIDKLESPPDFIIQLKNDLIEIGKSLNILKSRGRLFGVDAEILKEPDYEVSPLTPNFAYLTPLSFVTYAGTHSPNWTAEECRIAYGNSVLAPLPPSITYEVFENLDVNKRFFISTRFQSLLKFDPLIIKFDRVNELFFEYEKLEKNVIRLTHKDEILALLKEGIYPSQVDNHVFYVSKDTPEVLDILLEEARFNPNVLDRHNCTFLEAYSKEVSDEVVKKFVDAGAYLTYPPRFNNVRYLGENTVCPLINIIKEKRVELLEYLLINHKDKVPLQVADEVRIDGKPTKVLLGGPLHYAVERNHNGSYDKVINLLLEHGANKNALYEETLQKIVEVDGKLVLEG